MEWFNFKLPEFLRPNRTKLLFLSSVVGVSYLIYLTAKLFRRDKRINSPDDRNSLDESELVGGVPFSYIRDELARKSKFKFGVLAASWLLPTEIALSDTILIIKRAYYFAVNRYL